MEVNTAAQIMKFRAFKFCSFTDIKIKSKIKHIPETTMASLGPQVSKPTIARTTNIYNKNTVK
jgi:hypothetical protein